MATTSARLSSSFTSPLKLSKPHSTSTSVRKSTVQRRTLQDFNLWILPSLCSLIIRTQPSMILRTAKKRTAMTIPSTRVSINRLPPLACRALSSKTTIRTRTKSLYLHWTKPRKPSPSLLSSMISMMQSLPSSRRQRTAKTAKKSKEDNARTKIRSRSSMASSINAPTGAGLLSRRSLSD